MSKSQKMKEKNANNAKLSLVAREIYMLGIARLSKAEEVASSGYTIPSYKTF